MNTPIKSTRLFNSKNGDIFLCEKCQQKRKNNGEQLGVPTIAAAFMMGLKPWPTSKEPCFDCKTLKILE